MPAQVFTPTGLTTLQYTGVVASVDEFPHSGTDRLQTPGGGVNPGVTATATFDFDVSGSVAFARPFLFVMAHVGTQSGGWSSAAQLVVGGVGSGSPVTRVRSGAVNAVRYSVFHFPASHNAAMAADPDGVQVTVTSTNLHGTAQHHHIHSVALILSPMESVPSFPGVDPADLVAAWVPAYSAPEHLAHNDTVAMVPDLVGGNHAFAQLAGGTLTYRTDDGVVDHAVSMGSARFSFTLDVAAPGYTDLCALHFVKTPVTLPTGDSSSQVVMAGWDTAAIAGGTADNVVWLAYAGGSSGTPSWLMMTGSVGAESDHLRSNAPSPADGWVIAANRLNSAGNDMAWIHEYDDGPVVLGDEVIDADSASIDSTFMSGGIGSRADGSRNWAGKWAGTVLVRSTVSDADLLTIANAFATAIGLQSVVTDGATATVNLDPQAGGSAFEGPAVGPDPAPPSGPLYSILLRAEQPEVPDSTIQVVSLPYHYTLASGYGWVSADRDGYRVAYGFLDEPDGTHILRYAFVGSYDVPGEDWSGVVFDQGGTDWTMFLWDGSPWDPETQGTEANDAPLFDVFAPQARPDERPVIRVVEDATGDVVELRNYGALTLGPGVEVNQLAHITTPQADVGRRPDSVPFTRYERIQVGFYKDGSRVHGGYYDVIAPGYHLLSSLDTVPGVASGGATASVGIHAEASVDDPPVGDDPLTHTGPSFLLRMRANVEVPVPLWDDQFYRGPFSSGAGWREGDVDGMRAATVFLDRGDGTLVARVTYVATFILDAVILSTGSDRSHFLYDGTPWDPDTQGADNDDIPAFSTVIPQDRPDERPTLRIIHRPTGAVLEKIDYTLIDPPSSETDFMQVSHISADFTVDGARPDTDPHTVYDRVTVVAFNTADMAVEMLFDAIHPDYRISSTLDESLVREGGSTAQVNLGAQANEAFVDGATVVMALASEGGGNASNYLAGITANVGIDAQAGGFATVSANGGATAVVELDAIADGGAGYADGATATVLISVQAASAADYAGPFVGGVRLVPDFEDSLI